MVFKLIRLDTQDPLKIVLDEGIHVIGRGRFLVEHENDRRVGRVHAELRVTEDTVSFVALHKKPCFYQHSHSKEPKLLLQYEVIKLQNLEKFGLTPDAFWYQLVYCPKIDKDYSVANRNEWSSTEEMDDISDTDSDDEVTKARGMTMLQKSLAESDDFIKKGRVRRILRKHTKPLSIRFKRAYDGTVKCPIHIKTKIIKPDAKPGHYN